MAGLATVAMIATSVVGTIVSAGAQAAGAEAEADAAKESGRQQQQFANYEAAQADVAAGQERAASQRAASEQRRRARLVQSRQLAVAAASGAGASDPTVENLMLDTHAEGEYRALTELYEGEERARGLEHQAEVGRYQGRVAKYGGRQTANNLKFQSRGRMAGAGMGTLLDTSSTLFGRYG